MSRPLRITYPGAWYHVMNRGLARNTIFFNDKQREVFLELLFDLKDRYSVEIHAYCLMSNHYHLLIKTPLGNISRAMRHLDGIYTQRINRILLRDGPIFRGRYKAILIEADSYMLRLSRYIHLNPVKAKIVSKGEEYPWSSYQYFLSGGSASWLSTDKTLNYFDSHKQVEQYKAFIEEGNDDELEEYFNSAKKPSALGTRAFLDSVAKKHIQNQHKINDIPEHKSLDITRPCNINQIMGVVAEFYGVKIQDLQQPKRKSGNLPRAVAMYLSRKIGQFTFPEIALTFKNTSTAGASHSYHRIREIMILDNILTREVLSIENKMIALMSYLET